MKNIDYSDCPQDCENIKRMFPLLHALPDQALELLYEKWSDDVYAQSHIKLTESYAQEFYLWLFTDRTV
jgi:hypothetical protein